MMKALRFCLMLLLFSLCFESRVVGFSRHAATKKKQPFPPRRLATKLKSASDVQAEDALSRRDLIQQGLALAVLASGGVIYGIGKGDTYQDPLRNSDNDWQGTALPLLSLDDAYSLTTKAPQEIFPFAQWPDPILRRPASTVALPSPDLEAEFLEKLRLVAQTLQRTAHQKGALGLAAQQCGIDVSLVYVQINKRLAQDKGLFLLNPRIVQRSPERDMLVWTEECLVLPPSFRATLLRDATVTVEYESIYLESEMMPLSTHQVTLQGELARCVQHEMQHDNGVLITDHMELEDLPTFMQDVEAVGHRDRMIQAFDRGVSKSSLATTKTTQPKVRSHWQELLVPTANAAETECDEACLAERKRIIQERRAMMQQSRTNTRRQDVFELSQQRAAMCNTTYRGAQCPPGIPCL